MRSETMAFGRGTWVWPLVLLLSAVSAVSAQHQIVCSGEAAGGYAAFPDVCRLRNGELFCVFYSGYGHVSTPNAKWPKGGRIMACRSSDNGQNWSKPVIVIDTDQDDRDPSVACLKDGTLLLNWFTLQQNRVAILLARSTYHGKTWSEPIKLNLDSPRVQHQQPGQDLAGGQVHRHQHAAGLRLVAADDEIWGMAAGGEGHDPLPGVVGRKLDHDGGEWLEVVGGSHIQVEVL